MIKSIGSEDTSVLEIEPLSGVSVGDIMEEMEKDTSQYNEVIIVAGGNTTTNVSAPMNSLLL